MGVKVTIVKDNVEKVIEMSEEAIEKSLTEIGLLCEGSAKKLCAVDTGLLRNSITFALDGEEANIGEYKADKAKSDGVVKTGAYSGVMPAEGSGKRAVFIGTNVEYAPFIEAGSSKKSPNGFLKPAVQANQEKIRTVIKKNMENA